MAEENVTTNIVVNSNFTDLISDLNRASAALMNFRDKLSVSNKALASQVAVMNRTFAETMRSTGQFSTHFVSLNSDVDKFGQQLDKGQIKLNQFFRVFNAHTKTQGGLIRQLAQQQVQLQNAILQPLGRNAEGIMQYNVHIPRGLDLVKNKTALARQELQILNKVVQEGANQLINWGKNTQWAGRQLTVGLTVPLAAFGKAAADAFNKADQELVRLTKVYGGVAATSSTELKKIRNEVAKTAAELAKQYGASFQDTISLAADIAATGKQGNDLLNSVRETTRLAVLGEVDRQDAMKATLAIQTAFKQNTQQLGESINFLNAVENQTSTTLQDLIEAIPKAGPVIKGMGGSVKDLALYLTAMREGGISAAEGANALKSGLASLINPTKVARDTFKGFGIDLEGIVNRNAGNVTNTILELQKSLDKLDPLKKQKALEQLFGKFQFARMNALFSNLGKQGSQTLQVMDLMKASSQDLANIAGRELSQVTESASGKYRRALEGLKADLAGVGEQFLKINTALINIVDKVIQFANHLPKPIKQLLGVLGMFTAAAGPLIMLTGVLGNFIGYVIKGVFHLRSLFKGGEGWKLLTPEILAANKAGALAENVFYSDAKAASILKQSLDGLVGSYAALEARINSGVLEMPMGNVLLNSAERQVNTASKYLSPTDTRSMSHTRPVAMMTSQEKSAQTLFGVVPGAPVVNNIIGKNPQMYMSGDLPKIEGLTSIRGVSTGIVSAEAAQWHAMTAALATLSQTEIKKLKTEVARTGLITDELSASYEAMLPAMTQLTEKAAAESAVIVSEMRAGKLTVDQARAKIMALNTQIESMMVQESTQIATSMGRTIDTSKVPLLNQPIVDPRSGKSNMKELFKPGRTRNLINKIAGALGVKTYGARYSIETTIPKKFNSGNMVPGTGNTDTVPAMLTPGEFVVNKQQTARDPQGLEQYNKGQAIIVPIQRNKGGHVPGIQYFGAPNAQRIVQSFAPVVGRLKIRSAELARFFYDTSTGANLTKQAEAMLMSHHLGRTPLDATGKPFSLEKLQDFVKNPDANYLEIKKAWAGIDKSHAAESINIQNSDKYFTPGVLLAHNRKGPGGNKSINTRGSYSPLDVANSLDSTHIHPMSILAMAQEKLFYGKDYSIILSAYNKLIKELRSRSKPFTATDSYEKFAESILGPELSKITNPHQASIFWNDLMSMGTLRGIDIAKKATSKRSLGAIHNVVLNPQSRLEEITAKWPKKEAGWPLARSYTTNNEDPLHGPLMIGRHRGMGSNTTDPFAWTEKIYYDRSKIYPNTPSSYGYVEGFPVGNADYRAKYLIRQYMQGNYKLLDTPEAKQLIKRYNKKFTGKLFRGVNLEQDTSLPKDIIDQILLARAAGDMSSLIGKEFIMRQSSWSASEDIAKGFGRKIKGMISYHNYPDLLIESRIKNRNTIPTSELFPEAKFNTSTKKVAGWGTGSPNISEQEHLVGGKFKVVWAGNRKIIVEAREKGGNVNSGNPYLVGEKGPELFVPKQTGDIIPHYGLGGLVAKAAGFGLPLAAGMLASNQVDKLQLPGIAGLAANLAAWSAGATIANKALKVLIPSTTMAAEETGKFSKILGGLNLAGKAIPGWGKVAAVALIAVATASYGAWEKARKARLASQEAIKLDKDKASQVGITYQSVIDKIKETTNAYIEQSRLLRTKAAGADAIGGGVNLTISQFKDLQKQIQSTSPDIIKMFNEMNKNDVVKNVSDLKAQLVSAGKSAQEATNYIYTMLSLTNKKDMTTSAMGSNNFTSIYDQLSAAKYSVKNVGKAFTSNTDKKELAASFDQGLTAIDQYFSSIEKVKDATGKLVVDNEAVSKTMDAIKNSEYGRQKIGEKNLQALLQQKPELNGILNSSDSIADAWAKYKLYTSGISADLTKINGQDAQNLLTAMQELKKAADAMTTTDTSSSNPLRGLVLAGNAATAAAKTAQKLSDIASQNAQTTLDAETKAIDKIIQKLNEEYDARKKLIELQASNDSYKISVQKEELNYRNAVSAGDTKSAAQAQLNLQQLNIEYQKQKALTALEDKHNADLKAQEDAKAKAQERLTALQTKAAKLADAAAKAQQKANSISIIQQSISNTIAAAAITKDKDKLDQLSKALESDFNALKQLDPKNAALLNIATSSTRRGPNIINQQDWLATLNNLVNGKGNLLDDAAKQAFKDFGTNVDTFGSWVAKLKGLPSATTTGKPYGNPGNTGAPLLLERKSGKWVDATGREYSNTEALNTPQALPKNSQIAPYQHPLYSGQDVSSIKGLKDYTDDKTGLKYTANGDVYQKSGNNWVKVGIWYNETYGTPGVAGKKTKAYAKGGFVRGKGTTTSDSIPVWLSDKEYVFSAKAVDNLGGPNAVDKLHNLARLGKEDPKQSFLNKLIFGTRYVGGNTKIVKNEIPFGPGNIAKAFNAADISVLKQYIERPMLNANAMSWVLDKANFGKDAGTFFRGLSNHDMAAIAGYTRVPNRMLEMGKTWMDQFAVENGPMSHMYKDMTQPSAWGDLASNWKKGTANLFKQMFKGKQEPVYGSEASLPFMDLNPALKIGQIWRPDILKSVTKELEFAKEVAAFGGTGGGETKAIAKIIVDPLVKGISDFRNLIPGHQASWKNAEFTEGAIAPFTKYVLQAINKNAHHITDEKRGVSHLIDEYVFKAVNTAPYGQFLNRTLHRYFDELPIVGKAVGGYIGKLHSWNGQVPGPYGSEVSAVLKAGTEGVYQTDYINGLKSSANAGNTIYLTNNITAAQGMDTEILAMKVVDMTKKALAADTIVSSSKIGPNKEFGSRVMA